LRLPFAGNAFDAALATNLLFLLPDPAAGLAALANVTRPGGIVAFVNPSDAMSQAAAESFAAQRGLEGFARFSFINYGRLAEAHHRLDPAQWSALAGAAGLTDVRCETRAAGLVVFVRGVKGTANGEC
jgi:ubiquinone/menaquinone biosynthesis C-methylase UbiE